MQTSLVTSSLMTIDATDIQEQGCYLHLPTGLLIRVMAEDLAATQRLFRGSAARLVRLCENPNAPVSWLRETAARYNFKAGF